MRNFAPNKNWEVVIDGVGLNLLHCIFVAPNAGLAGQQAMDKYGKWIHIVSVAEAPEKPPRDAHRLNGDPNTWAKRRRVRAAAAKRRQYGQPVDSLQISGV